MDINFTLLGQAITFALFVWFTMRFVWPPLIAALEARQNKIAEGLAAAEAGRQQLSQAQQEATACIQQARQEAQVLLEEARQRAATLEEKGRMDGRISAERERQLVQSQIAQAYWEAQTGLRQEVVGLAMQAAQKVLGNVRSPQLHEDMVRQLIQEIDSHG